jgi:hypothetical protein
MGLEKVPVLNQKSSERLLLVPCFVGASVLLSGISGPVFTKTIQDARTSNSIIEVAPRSSGLIAELQDHVIHCRAVGLPACGGLESTASLTSGRVPDSGSQWVRSVVFPGSIDTAVKTSGKGSLQAELAPDSPACAAALHDFKARCAARGVVFCQGFNDSSEFQKNINIFPNASYPTVFPAMDTKVGRSGSSLRIDVPPLQSANSGKFDTSFPAIGGANTEFYFQVATRISPEMLTNYANEAKTHWPTWKNHAFFNGTTSCTDMSVVTGLSYDGLIPLATANCSSRAFVTNGGTPPYLLQQGHFNCPYRAENSKICFYWPTNTWITFYYHVHLGNYNPGTDTYDHTTVQAWVAVEGQPYKQWVNISGWSMGGNGNGKWNHLELYPYMSRKDATTTYPTAHVWYDELIISTEPIAAPAVPPAVP